MPITSPIDALKRAGFNPLNAVPDSQLQTSSVQDPTIQTHLLQSDLADDIERNIARSGPGATAPDAPAYLRHLRGDVLSDPISREQGAVNDTYERQRQAKLAGFSDPQSAAQYGRNIEQAKLNSPAEVARIGAAGGLAQAQEQSRGAANVADINNRSTQSYYDFMKSLQAGGAGNQIRSLSAPHGGGVSFNPERVNPATTNELANARAAYTKATSGWLSGLTGAGAPEKARLDQLIQGAVAQHPAHPDVKALADQIVMDQKLSKLPFEQIAPLYGNPDGTPMSAQDQDDLREILALKRGF